MVKIDVNGLRQVELKRGGGGFTIQRGEHFNKQIPFITKEVRAAGSWPEIEPATCVLIRPAKDPLLNHMVMGHSNRHCPMNSGSLPEIRAALAIMNKRNDQRPKKHAEDEDAQDVPDIDPDDWVDPHWLAHRDSGAGEDRGSGEGDQSGGTGGEHRGSGDALATAWADAICDQVSGHASRLCHLHNTQTLAKTGIRGPISEQLSQTVAN